MGTRSLTMVVVDNEMKVAQYGQFDGYPESLGLTIRGFASDYIEYSTDREAVKNAFRNCRFITEEEYREKLKELGITVTEYGIEYNDYKRLEDKYPALTRDFADEILYYIWGNSGCELLNNKDFAADSLFCEWAYLINLDAETVEFYKGFNWEPLTEADRFYEYMEKAAPFETIRGKTFYPIRKILEVPFEELAMMEDDEFLAMFKPFELIEGDENGDEEEDFAEEAE